MSSKTQINIYISYLQFSALLANLGGILNGVLLIFNLIVYYINNMFYQMEFINDNFRIKNKELVESKILVSKSLEDFFTMSKLSQNGEKILINKPDNSLNTVYHRKTQR
jgi:hypothetical protein